MGTSRRHRSSSSATDGGLVRSLPLQVRSQVSNRKSVVQLDAQAGAEDRVDTRQEDVGYDVAAVKVRSRYDGRWEPSELRGPALEMTLRMRSV